MGQLCVILKTSVPEFLLSNGLCGGHGSLQVVANPFRGFAVSELPTPDELEELTQLRQLLEGYAVKKIAGRDVTEAIQGIAERGRAMERSAESPSFDYVAFNAEDAALKACDVEDLRRELHAHAELSQLRGDPGVRGKIG